MPSQTIKLFDLLLYIFIYLFILELKITVFFLIGCYFYEAKSDMRCQQSTEGNHHQTFCEKGKKDEYR
jgi:hypothetical protein